MMIMQGGDAVFWNAWALILGGMSVAFVWYIVITGRDRNQNRQQRGERELESYGELKEDHAPLSKFLIWTYVGIAIWAVVYLLFTGIKGLA